MDTTASTQERKASAGVPITDKVVRGLKLPEGRSKLIINDAPSGPKDRAHVPGFGVRMTRGGSKTFVLRYRASGRDRTIRIGPYGAWSVAAAREKAAELRRLVDSGRDPQAERAEQHNAPTVAKLFETYDAEFAHKLRPSTIAAYRSIFKNHIAPRIGKRKVASIEYKDVQSLHSDITRRSGPYMANRTVAVLSRLYSTAVLWRMVTQNPCKGMERNQEPKRDRHLRPEEVARLLSALPKLKHQQSANAFRLLLLTGARKGEVLGARWEQFDLQAGVWTKPGATTKQRTVHRVPLSGPALQLLNAMHDARKSDEWLFPSDGEEGHQVDLKNAWRSLRKLADIPDVRIHDLRHSYASFLAAGGVSLPVIGALLGHTQPGTTARYAHLLDDPLRAATDKVGALLGGVESGHQAEVVDIKQAKK